MGVGSGPAPFRDLVSPDGHHLTLITGCVFAAYAFHAISSTPSYIQVCRQFQRILSLLLGNKNNSMNCCIRSHFSMHASFWMIFFSLSKKKI